MLICHPMGSRNKFVADLSEQQIAELNDLIASDWNARTKQRAQAILLSFRRYTIDDISMILEYDRVTISRWLDQWQERGLDGLLENEGRGRKKTLNPAEEEQVLEWLKNDERSTHGRLAKIEKVFGKKISAATLRRLFKRHGKVWKRVRVRTGAYRTHGGCCPRRYQFALPGSKWFWQDSLYALCLARYRVYSEGSVPHGKKD